MISELFYVPEITGGICKLDADESRHLIRVLRFREGDRLHVTNGKGSLFEAIVATADPKTCILEIGKELREYGRRNYALHLAIAPTKNTDRLEWMLEKITEIGIDRITPIICSHSERRELKTERLHKVIVAAMKQSLSCYLPQLDESTSFKKFLESAKAQQKYICTQSADDFLSRRYDPDQDCLIMIGPEGDFSEEEMKEAKAHGFLPVSLGPARLRTETAGLVACTTIAVKQTLLPDDLV